MICPFCRSENIEGADECSNCGQALYGLDLPGGVKGVSAPAFIHQPISVLPKHDTPQVGADYPASLAVHLMQTTGAGCVLVTQDGELAGIITGTDLLLKGAGPKADLLAVTCGEIMTPDPMTLHENDTLAEALNAMAAGGFRHVPILRDDKPAVVIDVKDVFSFISPNLL